MADDLSLILEKMVAEIFRLQGADGGIDKAMTNYFADQLWEAAQKGYGQTLTSFAYDSPDYNMLKALRENVYQFSSAKNYAQLKELTLALIDDAGNIVDFAKFKESAFKINKKYVRSWLQTEYDTAIASGQMAGKWVNIINNKGTLPLLQYDAVMDSTTSQICSPLNGTILPVEHPFWNRFYPPNHFNCRSIVRQLASGIISDKIPSADIPKMFQTNLGQQNLIFPDGHPYFVGLPDEIKNRIAP